MTFTQLYQQTFDGLSKMEPGSAVEVNKTQMFIHYGQEFIIEVCKQFIDQGNVNYEFSNDYKYIKRLSH